MEDDDQPRVARAGRRAQPGRRAAAPDDLGAEASTDDLRPRPARADDGLSASGPANDGGPTESPTGPPAPRRAGGFMDSGPGEGGGGFMGGTAGGTSSFKTPAGGRPMADPLADDGGGRKFAGVSRRKQAEAAKADEEKAARAERYNRPEPGADGIMEIPELEEEGKEDLSAVVAAAPKVRTNRVQGISELEEDMQYRLPSTDDRDIDLSVLTTVLCSSEQVDEGDDVWEPDILFTDVASELNREKEKAEGPSLEEGLDVEHPEGLLGQMN